MRLADELDDDNNGTAACVVRRLAALDHDERAVSAAMAKLRALGLDPATGKPLDGVVPLP